MGVKWLTTSPCQDPGSFCPNCVHSPPTTTATFCAFGTSSLKKTCWYDEALPIDGLLACRWPNTSAARAWSFRVAGFDMEEAFTQCMAPDGSGRCCMVLSSTVRCRCKWTHWFTGAVHILHDVVHRRKSTAAVQFLLQYAVLLGTDQYWEM